MDHILHLGTHNKLHNRPTQSENRVEMGSPATVHP